MLTVTASAAQVIRDIAENADLPAEGGGIRFSLDSRIGDDVQLQVALVRAARDGDEDVETDGSHVYLDADAVVVLSDKVLDAAVLDNGHMGFSLADQT